MKDIVTPVPPEEVRLMIKKSLETAALVNYTRLSSEAKIEGKNWITRYGTDIWIIDFQHSIDLNSALSTCLIDIVFAV